MLFDLDGTLADTIPLIVASYQHAFRTVLAEEVEEGRARAWIGRPLLPALLEESPEHGHELDRVYREWNLANTARADPSVCRGARAARPTLTAAGVTCAVATSKRRETARLALVGVGIDHLVDVVAALEDTTAPQAGARPAAARRRDAWASTRPTASTSATPPSTCSPRGPPGWPPSPSPGVRGSATALAATGPDALVDTVADLATYLLGRRRRLESPPCTGRGTRRTSTPSSRRSRMP